MATSTEGKAAGTIGTLAFQGPARPGQQMVVARVGRAFSWPARSYGVTTACAFLGALLASSAWKGGLFVQPITERTSGVIASRRGFYNSDRRYAGAVISVGESGVDASNLVSMVQIWSTIANSKQPPSNGRATEC